MRNNKTVGAMGEKIAEKFLKNKGYQILAKNYVPKFISGPLRAEIDIIAKQKDIISFIEIKTLFRKNQNQILAFSPEDKINWQKQRKILKAAESWLMKNKIPLNTKWQIETISVVLDKKNKKAKIKHFKNITF